ncbi:aldose 1-epimerase [Postechiella marina]|uniref:Aldose 1-epimerase n=1 Tax=Postechiella marina TaxID=943941 RepID=A0ABP8CD40_9FLAO
MYNITHHQELNTLEISNLDKSVFAKIYLKAGASLQELTLGGHAIIQDLSPLNYSDTYSSSILFPFANRIKDGVYSFNGKTYQFEANQKEENNALHGLVYNKTFKIINKSADNNSASVTLEYNENKEAAGFPYTYKIQLEYTLTRTNLDLKVSVKNTSLKIFPFTLGWHPYFTSDDLKKSVIKMESTQKLIIGDRNITTGIEDITPLNTFNIEDKQLDDCWVLNTGNVSFNTPKYKLQIGSTGKKNFLQAYTPPRLNTIAIEPTTGVSDSFNNNIGLETLEPNETHTITWNLKID